MLPNTTTCCLAYSDGASGAQPVLKPRTFSEPPLACSFPLHRYRALFRPLSPSCGSCSAYLLTWPHFFSSASFLHPFSHQCGVTYTSSPSLAIPSSPPFHSLLGLRYHCCLLAMASHSLVCYWGIIHYTARPPETAGRLWQPTRFRAQSGDGVLQCEAWRCGGQHSTISGGAGSRGMPAAKTMLKMKN